MTEGTAGEPARRRATPRRRTRTTCIVCGRVFDGLARARYCSAACSQRAYRDRQRSEPRAPQRVRYGKTVAEREREVQTNGSGSPAEELAKEQKMAHDHLLVAWEQIERSKAVLRAAAQRLENAKIPEQPRE